MSHQMTVKTVPWMHFVLHPHDSVKLNLVGMNAWGIQSSPDEGNKRYGSYWAVDERERKFADECAIDLGLAEGEKSDVAKHVPVLRDVDTRSYSPEHSLLLDKFLTTPAVKQVVSKRKISLQIPGGKGGIPWLFDDFGRWEDEGWPDTNANLIRYLISNLKAAVPFEADSKLLGEDPIGCCGLPDALQSIERWWKWFSKIQATGTEFDSSSLRWVFKEGKYTVQGPSSSGSAGFKEWKDKVQSVINIKGNTTRPDWTQYTAKEDALMMFGFPKSCAGAVSALGDRLVAKEGELSDKQSCRKIFRGLEVLVKGVNSYKAQGSLSDAASVVTALYTDLSNTADSKLAWRSDWTPHLSQLLGANMSCPDWYPGYIVLDGELDDIIAWSILEYVAHVCKQPSPKVLLQVPTFFPKGYEDSRDRIYKFTSELPELLHISDFIAFFNGEHEMAWYSDDGCKNGRAAYLFWPPPS